MPIHGSDEGGKSRGRIRNFVRQPGRHMPPWVRMQFPQAGLIVRHLRDTNCGDPACVWCADKNDPNKALERWFGFPAFRPEPVDEMGRPLQERIVAEAMAGKSVLGILPTGTGKSVCYQIPALSRFDKTGALTVVISPLVALMADQVQGLARAGIANAVTVNGMLSLPERHDALEKVRMGDAAILLISPEQLRSPSIRTVLQQASVTSPARSRASRVVLFTALGGTKRPELIHMAVRCRKSTGVIGALDEDSALKRAPRVAIDLAAAVVLRNV